MSVGLHEVGSLIFTRKRAGWTCCWALLGVAWPRNMGDSASLVAGLRKVAAFTCGAAQVAFPQSAWLRRFERRILRYMAHQNRSST